MCEWRFNLERLRLYNMFDFSARRVADLIGHVLKMFGAI